MTRSDLALSSEKLAPGFLIAPPPLSDPNFDRSLILLAAHEATGSMGFVINRHSDLSLHQLLTDLEIKTTIDDKQVFLGGPVNGFSGFVMYEHDIARPLGPGIAVSEHISISPARDVLEAGARGELPGRFELLLGYAGWSADQLDEELGRGAWLHSAFDPELLFEVPVEHRWDEAYRRLGSAPYNYVNVPGGAQA